MAKTIADNELVRLYAEPGRGHTDQELADRFRVGRDAIFRRRQKLTKEHGEDFFMQTERGRYRVDTQKFISNIKVSWEEALVLYLATRRLSRNTPLPKRPVREALSKLATSLYKPMTERLVKAAGELTRELESDNREEILQTLLRGWSEQLKVHITYHPLTGNPNSKHSISPYLIEPSPWSDSVYVIAKTNVFEGMVPFKLERIVKAVLSTEPFKIDPQFAEETLFKYVWGIWFSDQEAAEVKLRFCGREAIQRLQESRWHRDETVSKPDEEGCVIWSAPVAEWKEMIPWIRGWGADVEVLAPLELRETLMGEARRLAKLYGWYVASQPANQSSSVLDDFFGG